MQPRNFYPAIMDINYTSQQGHILVASSDPTDIDTLRDHFESAGYVLNSCQSLREIYMTELSGYSLILLELNDNIDEGIHAIQSIKGNLSSANIPVLVYSTTRRSDILVNALNAGADDYVIKPFSLRELTARVRAVLRATRRG